MTSIPLDGPHRSLSTGKTQLPTTVAENPELLAAVIAARELEVKKQNWASWAETEFTKCKNARHPFEQQWYLNLAFTAGKQYVSPLNVAGADGGGFRLVTPKSPPWRVRLVVNKIRTAVRTECSKLTTSKPIPTVMPATNEDEDYSAAAVAEQVLKSSFATAQFESSYRMWIWWGVVCGTSFMKQYWSPSSLDHDAKTLPDPPTIPGPDGQPMEMPEQLIDMVPGLKQKLNTPRPAVGKICREHINPFHIFVPDLLNDDLEAQPYLIHVMTKSPLWVKKVYGIDATPDSRASTTILDAATIVGRGAEEHLDSVMVKEIWIKPQGHPDFPEGGMLTVINGKVVYHAAKWPYIFPEFPYYKYNGIPTGGFYSDSIVTDLIPVQKEYNKKRSQSIEIQNTMGKPKFFYQRGSLDPKKMSSEPGQSVPYTPGYEPPIPIPGAEVPVSFINELNQLLQEFDDISGQHEVSRGQLPSAALSSGTAIAYLQEQDDAKLTYQVASIENACELLGSHYLMLASFYWDDNRLIRTAGKDQTFEALHWKKGMLRGNTDVKVQTGSALPYSKAAKQALVTEMMQNGFLDPKTGLEMMNFGGMGKAIEDALVDKRQAMRENLKMSEAPDSILKLLLEPAPGPNGEQPMEIPANDPTQKPMQVNGDGTPFQPQPPIPVNSWDNHEEHIYWHNHFRKSQQFELLSPLKKKAFEMHVEMHQIALMATMQGVGGNTLNGPTGEEEFVEEESSPEGSEQPPFNQR